MAITGVKKFAAGAVLTASDTNQYLSRGVFVFASAAARTSAFSTAGITLEEGWTSYLLDTNQVEIYDGAAWVGLGVNPLLMTQGGATTGQGLTWSGTAWAPTTLTVSPLISDQVLGADAASVVFSSIPQTFKHLEVRASVRSTLAATSADRLWIRVNGDTSANYSTSRLIGNGAAVVSDTQGGTGCEIGYTYGATATANLYSAHRIEFPNYTAAYTKAFDGTFAARLNGSYEIGTNGGYWNNTAAITSLTVLSQGGGNLKAGTRVTLYGWA